MARRRPHLAPALIVALLLPAQRALADVAATGTFDISVAGFPPAVVSFDGSIAFDPGERIVLDEPVNMASEVGDMIFDGDVSLSSESATFSLEALPDGEAEFEFSASGAGSCDNTACAGGTGTFAGRLTIIDPADVLPQGIYTFDGAASTSGGTEGGPGGAFAINAFRRIPTPAESNVSVSTGPQTFWDTIVGDERDFVASARFARVSEAGDTEFVAFSALPGAFPGGIDHNAMVAVFVDVSTKAKVEGAVRLCLGYPDTNDDGTVGDTSVHESRLRLLHAATIGAAFADVTEGAAADGWVCGFAPAVGPIVIGVVPPDATTTTSTSSTTSTSNEPGESTTTSTSVDPGTSTTSTSVAPGTSTTTSTSLAPTTSTTTSSTAAPARSTTTSTAVVPTTTSSTLPVCTTALDCVENAIAGPLCRGETVNQKLSTLMLNRLASAQTALIKSLGTDVAKKKTKLVGKARKQLTRIETKAAAFANRKKHPISAECRDKIVAAVGLVTQQIEANRI